MSPIKEMYQSILNNISEIFQVFRSPKAWLNYFITHLKRKDDNNVKIHTENNRTGKQ